MKILHCCLAAFYIDNYGYQENILPKMHLLQGHEVEILASTENYAPNREKVFGKPRNYINENGIPVKRIPYVSFLPSSIARKLRIYNGILDMLNRFQPEIIFIHDCQFIGIKEIAKYVKVNPGVNVFVDSHTDFINSAKGWISRNILHKVIYRWCAQKIEPYTKRFFGTLPLRMDFYHDVYGIPKNKLDLLVLGADHTEIDFNNRAKIRTEIRDQLGIKDSDFVIVSGGKIDRRKEIHSLLEAMPKMSSGTKLIIFGSPTIDMKDEIEKLSKLQNVHNIGWLAPSQIYKYLFSADLGVFPGTHSVLWEFSAGVGLPCLYKKWKGIEHVDLNGNCQFLINSSHDEIIERIESIKNDKILFESLKQVAMEKGIKEFSYYEIAKRAIEAYE